MGDLVTFFKHSFTDLSILTALFGTLFSLAILLLIYRKKRTSQKSVVKKEKRDTSIDPLFVAPADWPGPGPIDLNVQDLPHASATTEWWYINSHVTSTARRDEKPREFSVFASFFKRQFRDCNYEGYALSWAIVDVHTKKYWVDSVFDQHGAKILKAQLERNVYKVDKLMKDALLEVVNQDKIPLPDRLLNERIKVAKRGALSLSYGGNTLVRDNAKGTYKLHCRHPTEKFSFTLDLVPQKQTMRQAHDGVVKIGIDEETMFYYFIPRLSAVGEIAVPSQENKKEKTERTVDTFKVSGTAWYDHEFGGEDRTQDPDYKERHENDETNEYSPPDDAAAAAPSNRTTSDFAWNWLSLQLSNGSDITATSLIDPETNNVIDNFAIVIDSNSNRVEYDEMSLKALNSWVSIRTTLDYPTKWHFTVPAAKIDLHLEAVFEEQEFITLISRPAFWEGRMHASGTVNGKKVTGLGFMERHGFTNVPNLGTFFKRISKEVNKQVQNVIPVKPNYEQTLSLVCSKTAEHLMRGVDVDIFSQAITGPLREIIDRGGKSWRSFCLTLCVDAVGGDGNEFRHWLAMPEIMHVGSLIIDDIQDRSEMRRGGPACHKMLGEALAINCGNAAYFIAMTALMERTANFPAELKNYCYEQYFLTLRAGHAGQAFDIMGLDHLMPAAIASGDNTELLDRIECTHTLKSAAPAGCLARMGATTGGGSPAQVECLGRYFESVGLAFQIMDDVLNLRGFSKNSKNRGEDITAGKITHPIAMAMSSSRVKTKEARQSIYDRLRSKPDPISCALKKQDSEKRLANATSEEERGLAQKEIETQDKREKEERAILDGLLEELEENGAIGESVDVATRMVEDAWQSLDSVIPNSYHKLLLRAFGQFILNQYY